MDSQNPDRSGEQKAAEETPEDVAVLYSWANLQGAKYRDFSASRREFRAQMKHRAAEAARQAEEKAKEEAEEAARREEEAALKAAEEAKESEEAERARAAAEAARLAQKAAHDRVEAARHAEAAAAAEAAARRAEREAIEAHAHAERQAEQYGYAPTPAVPGEISDPYSKPLHEVEVEHHIHRPTSSSANRPAVQVRPGYSSGMRKVPIIDPVPPKKANAPAAGYAPIEQRYAPEPQKTESQEPLESPEEPVQTFVPTAPVRVRQPEPPTAETMAVRQPAPPQEYYQEAAPARSFIPVPAPPRREEQEPARSFIPAPPPLQQREEAEPPRNYVPEPPRRTSGLRAVPEDPARNFVPAPPPRRQDPVAPVVEREDYGYGRGYDASQRQPSRPQQPVAPPAPRLQEPVRPAWLYGEDRPSRQNQPAAPAPAQPQIPETLQHSRERVASRWFALKGVFNHSAQEQQADQQPSRQKDIRIPTLEVFSLAGGVGKTSLVATVGRALSSIGEKVLLTDTTSHGLLPFYFGARELRPGVVRTFSPPPGSTDAPIHMVNYELDQRGSDQQTQEWVMDEIARNGRGVHRMLVDLSVASGWLTRRLARLNPTVLVPVTPDMNSVISLQSVEKYFQGMTDADGRPVQPYYVLNQYDSSLPLHLDVREVMRQLVGDRLLPFVIRRSQAVSEALAEGMTVMDYAPASPVAEDYMNVASWVRTITAPATAGYRGARWSER